MPDEKKKILKITNLKQYFPLKEKGKFVKANDGIDIDIYEGETLGLVGESGCGKSTFGRTILELYPQTDGQTMYYGRTLDEMAPEYMKKTINDLPNLRTKYQELVKKREEAEAAFAGLKEGDEKTASVHAAMLEAQKREKAALNDIANIFGGFITVKDTAPAQKAYLAVYEEALKLRDLEKKRMIADSELEDQKYLEKKGSKKANVASAEAALAGIDKEMAEVNEKLVGLHAEIAKLREQYKDDPEFQKYEAYLDEGIDLARLNDKEMRELRSDLQLIFQDPYSSLNPRMTVGQIIGEGMASHDYIKKKSPRLQDKILETMEMCGLAPYFIHRFPHQFSGGQRQRIGIARALSTDPKFVICDEAVSALDVSIQSQIINLLQDLKEQKNLTYLFITHDLSVVKYISDRIGVMYLGNIVELAESQELFDHPTHPYTEALLSAIPTTNEEREIVMLEGDIPSPVNPPKGCKFHTRCKYCTEECTMITPELKEVRPGHFAACHHLLNLED
ncbi:MAG: ATP-binding cassette domain-containing protein [Eubacterium sp.]|nr:ATP-binding cassette domain-containing protein [Eubacterium sp.]